MKRSQSFLCFMICISLYASMLTACHPTKPSQKDILGLWVEYPKNKGPASQCGSFEFFEGGEFEAKNIPKEYFVPAGYDSPERIDAYGSWELDTSSNDPFAVHRVVLLFSPIEGLPSEFEGVLYIALGNDKMYAGVDESVLFQKGESANRKDELDD